MIGGYEGARFYGTSAGDSGTPCEALCQAFEVAGVRVIVAAQASRERFAALKPVFLLCAHRVAIAEAPPRSPGGPPSSTVRASRPRCRSRAGTGAASTTSAR